MQPNIVIKITADIKNFLTGLQAGFAQAQAQSLGFAATIKTTLTSAFNAVSAAQKQTQATSLQLSQALASNSQQFNALKASTTSYMNTVNSYAISQNRIRTITQDLVNIQAKNGVSMREAAQIALETGRVSVNAVNAVLVANNRLPLSYKEINVALTALATNVNRAAQGLELITVTGKGTSTGLNNLGDASQKTGDRLGFLANRLRGVLTNLIIVTAVFKFVQLMQELAKNAEDVSQATFNFNASLKAAQLTLGYSVGTASTWLETIKRLRMELEVFSERDIKGAVTQTLNLTKALKLSQTDMENIIRVAAALAKTTGVDLKDAVEDVVHALGGSKVVLDKYGLFLRDSDLRVVSLNLGLGKNTAALTSQQLALVTLNAIMAQTNNLIKGTVGYTDDLAGQMKQTGAEIEDTSDRISEKLGGLTLYFKNAYANFLIYVEGVVDKLKPLFDFIDAANAKTEKFKTEGAAGINFPDYRNYSGLYLNNTLQELQNANTSITRDTTENLINDQLRSGQLKPGDVFSPNSDINAMKDYLRDLEDYYKQADELQKKRFRDPRYNQGPRYNAPAPDVMTDDEKAAAEQFGIDVAALMDERTQKLNEAKSKFFASMTNLIAESRAALAKLDADFANAKDKLAQKTGFANADAATKYNRDLEDLQIDTDEKLADAEEKKNEKLKDNKKKFYDALRDLDREYYFNLFDAVAANDAVAIKAAERKYNLDKQKLQDKLAEENDATNENFDKTIEQIRQETEQRKAELKKRYDRELADIALQNARELAQLIKDYEKEKAATKKHYDDLEDSLQKKYDNEKKIIDAETKAKYDKLAQDLAKEFDKFENHWELVVQGVQDYYGDLLEEEEKYYEDRKKLREKYKEEDETGTDNHGCLAGFHWEIDGCVPNTSFQSKIDNTTNSALTTSGNTIKLIIGSDGTLSDDIVDKVVGEVATVIQDIIVQRG